MHRAIVTIIATVCCFLVLRATAEEAVQQNQQSLDLGNVAIEDQVDGGAVHTREKRTLFLKKKLLAGAGLLGFGLGIAKGYKAGYYSAPEVHHVYLSPPVKYVEYVEKPIYIERIVPKTYLQTACGVRCASLVATRPILRCLVNPNAVRVNNSVPV